MINRILIPALFLVFCFSLACSSGGVFNNTMEQNVPTAIMSSYTLSPNPAGNVVSIQYQLHQDVSAVRLRIYDMNGNFVRVLENLPTTQSVGVITAWNWDLLDFEGKRVKSGAYLSKLEVISGETTYRLSRTLAVN
jgi:flagellar hook assembly protein FlgD